MTTDGRLQELPQAIDINVLRRRAAIFYEQGHLEAARQLAMDIVSRLPDHIETLIVLADTLREMGKFDEAIAVLSRVLRLEPNNIDAHSRYALTLFYKEDWARAWKAYDVRFRLMDKPPTVSRLTSAGKAAPLTQWRGGEVPTSLLVMAEQGLGDTIMFSRFLPLLTGCGVKVTFVAQKILLNLLKTIDAPLDLRPSEIPSTVAGIKAWMPLLDLPRTLQLGPEAFAANVPYLNAEPDRVTRRRQQIGKIGYKVGIAWQGNPDSRIDRGRSAPLSVFAPLAEIPGVRLISLQKGAAEAEVASQNFPIETPGADIDLATDGFRETAAIMETLDLVVTVDTAIAHLAGALGKPTFVMIKRPGSDWRWLFEREDSVWYPTVRLYRQKIPGDWNEVVVKLADSIRESSLRHMELPLTI